MHLIGVVSLSDGRRITVRPVLPQDDAGTQAFVRNLSKQSRYNRFFRVLTEIPPACLRLTEVDYHTHVGLVATSFSEGREVLVAEARYATKDDPTVAEMGNNRRRCLAAHVRGYAHAAADRGLRQGIRRQALCTHARLLLP
jgi:hypothetical protein